MKTYLYLVLGLPLSTIVATDTACPRYEQEINIINAGNATSDGVLLRCKYHPEKCEQLDCMGRSSNELFCIHIILNHCDIPINADVSISVDNSEFNFAFTQRVTHYARFPVTLKNHPFTPSGIPLKEYLEFTLVKLNDTAVKFGMKHLIELCSTNLGCTTTKIIDLTPNSANDVPVSVCNNITRTPLPKAQKCSKGKTGGSSGESFTTNKLLPSATHKSETALIVGGTLGGIIFIVIISGIFRVMLKKRNAQKNEYRLLKIL